MKRYKRNVECGRDVEAELLSRFHFKWNGIMKAHTHSTLSRMHMNVCIECTRMYVCQKRALFHLKKQKPLHCMNWIKNESSFIHATHPSVNVLAEFLQCCTHNKDMKQFARYFKRKHIFWGSLRLWYTDDTSQIFKASVETFFAVSLTRKFSKWDDESEYIFSIRKRTLHDQDKN